MGAEVGFDEDVEGVADADADADAVDEAGEEDCFSKRSSSSLDRRADSHKISDTE